MRLPRVTEASSQELRGSVTEAYEAIAERRRLGFGQARAIERVSRLAGYERRALEDAPLELVNLSTGCGDPLRRSALRRDLRVLDVGFGGGLDLFLAAQAVGVEGSLVGVELAPALLEQARQRFNALGLDRVELRAGLAEALPLEDGSIDLAIVNGTLNLCPDKASVLEELARALAPGGELALAEVVVEGLPSWVPLSRGLFWAGVAGALERDALAPALAAAGLEVELADERTLDTDQLEDLIDGGQAGLEVAGCSASGAIMGGEAAAALVGQVRVVDVRARKPR